MSKQHYSREFFNSNMVSANQLDLTNRKRGISNSSNSTSASAFGQGSTASLFPNNTGYRPHPKYVDEFVRENKPTVKYNIIGPFRRAKVFCPAPLRRFLMDPLNAQAQKMYGLIEMAQEEAKLHEAAAGSSKEFKSDAEIKMAEMARSLLKKK